MKHEKVQRFLRGSAELQKIELPDNFKRVADLSKSLCGIDSTTLTSIELFDETEVTYRQLAHDIKNAKKQVLLEYYIFQPDETGQFFLSLLEEKAKEGVSCYLLLDHVGSFWSKASLFAKFISYGGKLRFFSELKVRRPWSAHLRNHRKVAIIDGRIGFIGSQNIGNEYWRRPLKQKFQKKLVWIDTLVKIEGPIVLQLQEVFWEDWNYSCSLEKTLEVEWVDSEPSFQAIGKNTERSAVQLLPTGPDEKDFSLELVVSQLLYDAKQRVIIVSPYLVPTQPILFAIEAAVKRGVLVDILVPEKMDHWMVNQVAKSWYEEIIGTGAKLLWHANYFIHAKYIVVDGELTLMGSANMDERSFRSNFESSLIFSNNELAGELIRKFDRLIEGSRPVQLGECRIFKKLAENSILDKFVNHSLRGLLRTLSPLF